MFEPGALPPGAVLILEGESIVSTGADVTSWTDLSGNGNDVAAVGDPQLGSSPGGTNAISFDGAGDRAERIGGLTGLPTGNTNRSVFMVADYRSTGYGGFAWGLNSTNKTFGLIVHAGGNLAVQAWGGAYDRTSGTPGTGQGWLVQSAIVDANAVTHYRDGSLIDSFNRNYGTTNDKITIGAEIDNNPHIDMSVAAILVFDRALTPAERLQVEAYLASKYLGAP